MVTAIVPRQGSPEWRLVEHLVATEADTVRAVLTGRTPERGARLPGSAVVTRPEAGPVCIRDRYYGQLVGPGVDEGSPLYLDLDGTVRLGTVGGTTFAPYLALAEFFAAVEADHPQPQRRLELLKQLYQTVAGDTGYTASAVPRCAVCHSEPSVTGTLARCSTCGTLFRSGVSEESWEAIYRNPDGHYFLGLEGVEHADASEQHHGYEDYEEWARIILGEQHFLHRARHVAGFAGHATGRSLDVGCATGQMTAAMHAVGWSASGVDLSEYCVARAAQLYPNAHFATGTIADTDGGFDVVSYLDVFEHLGDPRRELALVREALAPSGVLFLELPNQDSVDADVLGAHYLFEEHLYFYGPAAISRLLGNCGFEVLDVRTEHDTYFRIDRVVGPEWGTQLARAGKGERLLVVARVASC